MIYLLEDDAGIRNLVIYALEREGLSASGFAEAGAFWHAMRGKAPSLAILDIMLPGEDGLSVLKKLRADPLTKRLPVMMLTAMGTEYDKVRGLDAGADDYLPKPFGMLELVARVKSLLRRASASELSCGESQDEYSVGGLTLSMAQRQVWVDGEPVALAFKEFETLAYLLKNQGVALTREQIMDAVWGYDYDGENRTVDVHIRALRSKLGQCEDVIETVRGVGYRIGRGAR